VEGEEGAGEGAEGAAEGDGIDNIHAS